jgi:hypothetical protein
VGDGDTVSITVCIPTIASRRSLLSRAIWSVPNGCDIIVADGPGAMGDKLNACFAAARPGLVVCLDDDDYLLPGFVSGRPSDLVDYIGYRILYTENGRFGGSVIHRGDGDTSWATFYRGVSPKCLIRTEIARAHPFGNHYTADREWSAAVQNDIEVHTFLDAHLYHYDHYDAHMVGTTPDAGMIDRPQRDVGVWPADWERVRWI